MNNLSSLVCTSMMTEINHTKLIKDVESEEK